jgi:hypothetical protein
VSLRATDYQALTGHPYSQTWSPPPVVGETSVKAVPSEAVPSKGAKKLESTVAEKLESTVAETEKRLLDYPDTGKSLDDDGGLRVVNGSVEGEDSVSSPSVDQGPGRGEFAEHQDDPHDSGCDLHKRVEKGYEITGIPPLEGLPPIRDLDNETEEEKEWYRVVEHGLFRVAEKYKNPVGECQSFQYVLSAVCSCLLTGHSCCRCYPVGTTEGKLRFHTSSRT